RRRGDALAREAREERGTDQHAFADRLHAHFADAAPVQPDPFLLEVRRDVELAVGRDRRRQPPGAPARAAPWRELAGHYEGEAVLHVVFAPGQQRRRLWPLRGGETRRQRLELDRVQCAQSDPARHHAADYSIIYSSMSSRIAAMPASAHASSSRPPGAPDTPIAPSSEPPASIFTPPPTAATPGRLRMPLCGRPGWVASASSVVLVRKLAAVYALAIAMSGVCGPAKRSRSSTCTTPMRSTTATVAWKPRSRQLFSAACAAFSAVSGVRTFTVKVASAACAAPTARPSNNAIQFTSSS